jgi:hypothetical protein
LLADLSISSGLNDVTGGLYYYGQLFKIAGHEPLLWISKAYARQLSQCDAILSRQPPHIRWKFAINCVNYQVLIRF